MGAPLPSLIIAGVIAMSGSAALAHHGWGGNTQPMKLSGTVVNPVSLSGPHATMKVRDAAGRVWDITLAPAPRTHRSGLRNGAPPAGAAVTLEGMRNADPARFEMKTRRVTWNGQNYDPYPPAG